MTTELKCNEYPILDEKYIYDIISEKYKLWNVINENNILKLSRKFTCKNFQNAIEFINAAAVICEERKHHPDIHLTSYRDIELVIYTHSLSGITQNDLNLIEALDNIKVNYSPLWLKQNPNANTSTL